MTLEFVFLAASALLQLVAILLALRLIKTTGAREVWLILAAALGMMMIQRLVLLAGVTFPGASPRFLPELVTLAASLLIMLSMFSIQSLFQARQRDEETLRESEERYHFLADSMPQIVWTARLDGNLDYYNQRWFDYTGMSFEETWEQGWQPVLHPEDRQVCVDRWRHSFTTGEPYEVGCRFRRAEDGEYRWHLARALPMRDDDGKIVFWVGTCTDIHDHRRALEENARLLEETRQAALRQRLFMREILSIVTEGRLCLCEESGDLPAPLSPASDRLELSPSRLEALRHRVAEMADSIGLPPERRDDLILATGEGAMNAVVHAGGGVAQVGADPARGVVQVRIEDRGKGIAIDQLHRATLERGYTTAGTMGHGFWMMLKTADRIWLFTEPTGTTVVLEQERAGRAEEDGWADDDIDALLASVRL